ncbi:Fatty-acid-CoA ligase FadD35_1 [Kappamyces sp. JEL0680]|nr:Fatty-acid-CoA ligase FadD35_1 [Kappamyces sp. JEL0680]
MVIPAESFDAKRTLQVVEAERCTSLYGVPTMFVNELPHAHHHDLSSLRTGIMAGSLCPEALMKQVVEKMHMNDVTIGYGQTETSPLSTQTLPTDSFKQKTSTVGSVHPHVEIKVVDQVTGEIVPRGELGEFAAKGYNVMKGYYGNAEATEASIKDGWMHSGDLAVMDDDGYISIVGRIKDLIIRGGENIYPKEIEDVLLMHPHIADAQVIGVPCEKYGELVCAWIQLKSGLAQSEVSIADITQLCQQELSRYKIPQFWHFPTAFPLTVSGKVQKYIMREMWVNDHDGIRTNAIKT